MSVMTCYLIVNDKNFIGIFNQLVNRKSCIVRFNDGIRNFGRGNYGESAYSELVLGEILRVLHIILSGNSSLILESNNVPIPDPVPPPKEWQS